MTVLSTEFYSPWAYCYCYYYYYCCCCCCSVRMGKKKNRNAVSERRRREARRHRRRKVSMQLEGLGERCKRPQWVRAKPGRQTTFGTLVHLVHFGLKMLYLARPSRAIVNAYLQKIANRLCQVIFVSGGVVV